MATDNENLRSIIGVPTPSADPDNDTLRAIGGIPALKDGASGGGLSLGTTFSTLLSPLNSTLHLPLVVRSP